MKILFIVPSYKPAYVYGGTIVVVARLAEQLCREGHDIHVYTTTANGSSELNVLPGKEMVVDGVKVTYFKRVTGDHTHISPSLWKNLYIYAKKFDIIHIHSWWNPLVLGAAWICRSRGVTPIFSPHGMLSTYIMETNNAGKKKLIHDVIGKGLLRYSKLHVTAQTEWDESMKIIPQWQGHVIPNLVQLSERIHERRTNDVFTIGFLSRIDPKKGLDILIKALAKVSFDYRLQIVGDGEPDYIDELKKLASSCGNADKLEWLGWKNGDEKFDYLAGLDLFALTSHNENFAVVVVEALSVGTPVMLSDQVGLYKYVLDRDMGWIVEMKVEKITRQLNSIFLEREKMEKIKDEAPAKIKEEYNDSSLAKEYINLYLSTARTIKP